MEHAEEEEAAETMAHSLASCLDCRSRLPLAILRTLSSASFHPNPHSDS